MVISENATKFYIPLFVFLGIFVFLLLGFVTCFILQRTAINKQYKLMKRFNYFNDNPIASNLKPFEYLVEKNEDLKPLYIFFDELNKTYKSQIEEIKKQIFDLSKYTKQLHFITVWKHLKEIEYNLDILKKEEESFKILNLDTYSYINNTTDISIVLSNIVSKLNAFLRDNNITQQFFKSNDSLKNAIDAINELTEEINSKLMSINIQSTHETFINSFIKIQELYNLTVSYYYISRYQFLVKTMTISLKEIIEKNQENIISKSIKEEIKELLNFSTKNLNESNRALWSKELDKTKKALSDQIINIDKCISDLSVEVKFQKLLDATFAKFKTTVKAFVDKYDHADMFETYKKISNDFNDYDDIVEKLASCTEEVEIIFNEIEQFKQDLSLKKTHSKATVERINEIYKKILHFLNENQDLHATLTSRIENYLEISITVDKLIMQLNYYAYYMKENHIIKNEISHDIKNYLNKLMNFQLQLSQSNYVDEAMINEISFIESMVNNIQDELTNFLILKELSHKLLMYFNRMSAENPMSISKANQFIQEGQYQNAINELIQFNNQMKKKKNK